MTRASAADVITTYVGEATVDPGSPTSVGTRRRAPGASQGRREFLRTTVLIQRPSLVKHNFIRRRHSQEVYRAVVAEIHRVDPDQPVAVRRRLEEVGHLAELSVAPCHYGIYAIRELEQKVAPRAHVQGRHAVRDLAVRHARI